MGSAFTDRANLVERAQSILDNAQRPAGHRVPNVDIYPHQWLWDSSFHAIALATLGDRLGAIEELEALFSAQTQTGFVPHMTYHEGPERALELWGHLGRSTITQPPMYGHALAVLGNVVASSDPLRPRVEALVERAVAGLMWLGRNRLVSETCAQVVICHPWESGCDDSPRWDAWMPRARYDRAAWAKEKSELVRTLVDDPLADVGASVSNPRFEVADAGFTALFAFNCRELSAVFDVTSLRDLATQSSRDLDEMWDEALGTWASRPLAPDDNAELRMSCRARTTDGLLGVLVSQSSAHVERTFAQLEDPSAFAAPYGPNGRAVEETGFEPDVYWRGPVWPQLSYLLYVAARRHGRIELAQRLARATTTAVLANNFAEYWNPFTGLAEAASAPHTWATIAVAMHDIDSPRR
jgi:hypothetical protein